LILTQFLRAAELNGIFTIQTRLVGGHCIGVDPYYLAQRSQSLDTILIFGGGRRLNDMGDYVAAQIVKLMIKKGFR
jgi:UDP-N-acetyl-D-mannosaminuronate dehydrogenase